MNNVGSIRNERLSAPTGDGRISFNDFLQKQESTRLMLGRDENELVCSPISMSETKEFESN